MPRSNQFSYVAIRQCAGIIFLALATIVNAQEVSHDTAAEPSTDVDQAEFPQEPDPGFLAIQGSIEGLTSAVESLGADPYAEAEQQRANDNLLAQRSMAYWAKWMFLATVVMTIVTAVGVGLIYWTLVHTRRAANAAEAAVREARESTDKTIAQMAVHSQRELRAYVFIDEPKRTRRDQTDPWEVEFKIKNFGQSPAYRVITKFEHAVADKNGPKLVPPEPMRGGNRTDVAPGHYFRIRFEVPELSDRETWEAFKRREKILFVWGRIDFLDTFEKERWSTFCLFQDGHYIRNLAFCPEGNETSEST